MRSPTGLATASVDRPLMLVVDDLHWADESTIRLLQFLARDTRPRRLAIVGTYRDTDLDSAHALSVALPDLVRDGLHLTLGGLGPRDVATLVTSMGDRGRRTPRVRSRGCTGRAVATRSSCGSCCSWSAPAAGVDAAPPNVRAVVSRRLQRLSETARDVLAAAAVLGGGHRSADSSVGCSSVALTHCSTALAEAEAAGLAGPDRWWSRFCS